MGSVSFHQVITKRSRSDIGLNDAMLAIPSARRCRPVLDMCGMLYVLASVSLGIYAMSLNYLYMENDLFWPKFRATGAQNVLIDLINDYLAHTSRVPSINMSIPSLALHKHYGNVQLPLSIYATYPRMVMYSELVAMDKSIVSLRQLDEKDVTNIMTQYCWVDFNRSWELAHTAKRQTRCLANDIDNGAMYLEAVLRNIHVQTWLDIYDELFTQSIGNALQESPEGRQWLHYIGQHTWFDVTDEVLVWTQQHLTRFALQWANYRQLGIVESITIENSLGLSASVRIKEMSPYLLGTMWTSSYMFDGLENDVWALGPNQSLVRNSNEFFENANPAAIEAYVVPFPLSEINQVVHDQLGPLGSIDLKYIAPPPCLLTLVHEFRTQLATILDSNARFTAAFHLIATQQVRPTPLQWTAESLEFYGGSPLCSANAATSFVQESFGFDYSCGDQRPLTVTMTPENILFVLGMLNPVAFDEACLLCHVAEVEACLLSSNSAQRVFQAFNNPHSVLNKANVIHQVGQKQLATMQFVGNSSGVFITSQRLVNDDVAWSAFGWMTIYDWALGQREAVSFQGDIQTLNLLSYAYAPEIVFASDSDVRPSLGIYLVSISIVGTFGLCGVVLLLLITRLQSRQLAGYNWFVFNRVVGIVWLGRPLLVIRALTAMICLSTAPVVLQPSATSTSFVYQPRGILDSMLLAGESGWLVYVLNDLLHWTTTDSVHGAYTICSSVLAWMLCVVLDTWYAPTIAASIDRQCVAHKLDYQIFCTSGYIQIGSVSRFHMLACIQVGSILVCIIVFRCGGRKQSRRFPSLALPGAAEAFLVEASNTLGQSNFDRTSCAMAGMLYLNLGGRQYIIDTNLWLALRADAYEFQADEHAILFPHAFSQQMVAKVNNGNLKSLLKIPSGRNLSSEETTLQLPKRLQARFKVISNRLWVLLGFASVVLSLFSNASYMFVLTNTEMANDFYWADFNSTGTHAYLANLFNKQLLVTRVKDIQLDSPVYGDMTQVYDSSNSLIPHSDMWARRELFRPTDALGDVISNLRIMDPCTMPWMFTQYCWLDFNQSWEMASTLRRQARCAVDSHNGAGYLEGVLRNMRDWHEWNRCWGASFEIGFAQTLRQSVKGIQWLDDTRSVITSIAGEIEFWHFRGIHEFQLQWQTYKTLGFRDSIFIKNALGVLHPLTLSDSRGKRHVHEQMSHKMYWSFAGDLWAVTTNETSICGRALIRNGAEFAFANASREQLLFENLTLLAPLTPGFASFQTAIGPFGAVDMKYVSCPDSLRQFFQATLNALTNLTYHDADAQSQFLVLPKKLYIGEAPDDWDASVSLLGGNILCGSDMPPWVATTATTMYGMFGVSAMCNNYFSEYFIPDKFTILVALLGFQHTHNVTGDDFTDFCAMDVYAEATCIDIYLSMQLFLTAYNSTFANLAPLAIAAQNDVLALDIVSAQYILNETTPQLYRMSFFNNRNRAWTFFSWCFMYDWAAASREVVSFQGDVDSITAISGYSVLRSIDPNPAEIPRDFSLLLTLVVQYVTVVFLFLAAWCVVYTMSSHGHIKGRNLLKMNRLVGLVWVGRPLLFIRSISALVVLHTSRLGLVRVGSSMTTFEPKTLAWYEVVLASSEMTWFVYILNDGGSCVTQHYTKYYAGKSCNLALAIAILWGAVFPIHHAARIERTCTAVDMDFELVCVSGVVEIGSAVRVGLSLALCGVCVVVCYLIEIITRKHVTVFDVPSFMLSSQAKYALDFTDWSLGGVYFVDKPTALMVGIISFESHGQLHLFDIKKWRCYTFRRSEAAALSSSARFRYAIPVLE